MKPTDLESIIAGALTLPMPVYAFSQAPDSLERFDEHGVAMVIYEGSRFEGKAGQTKRILEASVLMIHHNPQAIHLALHRACTQLVAAQINGCDTPQLLSDELAAREDGLFQAILTLEVLAYNIH